jgi:hypothetical protein
MKTQTLDHQVLPQRAPRVRIQRPGRPQHTFSSAQLSTITQTMADKFSNLSASPEPNDTDSRALVRYDSRDALCHLFAQLTARCSIKTEIGSAMDIDEELT